MSEESFSERILSLKTELHSYTKDINNHLLSIYTDHEGNDIQIDLTHNPLNALPMLQNDVLELLKEAKQTQDNSNTKELRECEGLVAMMKKISDIIDAIEIVAKDTTSSDIRKACESLVSLQSLLASVPRDYINTPLIKVLANEINILSYQFKARLSRLIRCCFQLTPGKALVLKHLQGMVRGEEFIIDIPIKLTDLWNALVTLQCTEEYIKDLIHSIWVYILCPLWREKKISPPKVIVEEMQSTLFFESIVKPSGATQASRVEDASSHFPSACRIPLPQLLDYVGQICSFLWSEVFCAHEEVIETATSWLFSKPFSLDKVLQETILVHMPKVESEMSSFMKGLEKPSRDLEAKLAGLKMLPVTSTQEKNKFLSDYNAELNNRFITEKRQEILSLARKVVLADYHNTMLATGDAQDDDLSTAGDIGDSDAILEKSATMQSLRFDSCQVSLASCRILRLIHTVMQQVCTSSPDLGKSLYHCARDCLELYLAIVPVKFAHIIGTVPRMGAVFFNDCCYMAHNCTLISHSYRQSLSKAGSALADTSSFIDFIPRLRAAGEEVLTSHVQEQRKTVEDLVKGINLAPEGEDDATEEVASRVANDEQGASLIVTHMQKLAGQWLHVLQDPVFERLLGYLVECVLRECMVPLLNAVCITETACTDISRIFKTIQRIRGNFIDQADVDLSKIVTSWSKFIAITDLLEFSLSDVAEWLPKRKFSSFTSTEMTSLVKALFEDSSRRQGVLNNIADMSGAF